MPDLPDVKTTTVNVEISRGLKLAINTLSRLERQSLSDTVREALYSYVRSFSPRAYTAIIRQELGESEPEEITDELNEVWNMRLEERSADLPF